MGIEILDGLGSTRSAGVRTDNRFMVAASNLPESVLASERGNHFFVDTGVIALTAVPANALLYMRNNSATHLHIRNVAFQSNFKLADLLFFFPPFSGTLISNAVAANVTNTNFTSGKTPAITAYQGVEGDTVNAGGYQVIRMGNGPDRIEDLEVIILGEGDALAFGFDANEACNVQISISAYYTTNGV